MLGDFLKLPLGPDWNCSTEPADWCMSLGYPDFAAGWRTTLDPAMCDAAAERAGGLVVLWDAGIGAAMRVVDDVDAGDIAIIEAVGVQAGAIFTGGRWAVRSRRTRHFLAPSQVRVVKAWRP